MLLKYPNIKYLSSFLKNDILKLPLFDNTFVNQTGSLEINISTHKMSKQIYSNTRGYFFLGDLNISNNIIFSNDIISFIKEFKFNKNPLDTFFIFSPGNILKADIDFLKSLNDVMLNTYIRPRHQRLFFICKWQNYNLQFTDDGYSVNSTHLPFDYNQSDLRNLLKRTNIKHL